jgi:hypothetical protein
MVGLVAQGQSSGTCTMGTASAALRSQIATLKRCNQFKGLRRYMVDRWKLIKLEVAFGTETSLELYRLQAHSGRLRSQINYTRSQYENVRGSQLVRGSGASVEFRVACRL